MSVHQSESLTLRSYPFAEAHKVVLFLTRDFGKVRGVAHGARSGHSRFGGSLEPLTYGRLTFSRRENQELAVIQKCEIIRAFPAYQLSWEVNLHFSYFSELLTEFSREQEPGDRLFRLALAVLESCSTVPVVLLARYFEFWLLQLEGILPRLDRALPEDLARKAGGFLRLHPSRLVEVMLSGDEIERLEKAAGRLIEEHLEKGLKTRKILKELL